MMTSTPVFYVATYVAFALTGVYRGIWRYAGIADIIRFANGALLAGVLVAVTSLFIRLEVSGSVAVLYVVLFFNLLVFTRVSFQLQRRALGLLALPTERVLIVGAGRMGEAAVRYIFSGSDRRVRLVGFVDDDAFKEGQARSRSSGARPARRTGADLHGHGLSSDSYRRRRDQRGTSCASQGIRRCS